MAWGGKASLCRTNALIDRIGWKANLPCCVQDMKRAKKLANTAASPIIPGGCRLVLRIHPDNPDHHLWWNNGTWWIHATIHKTDHTKHRVRRPLATKSVETARKLRDEAFSLEGEK